jgi:hypothetical protein
MTLHRRCCAAPVQVQVNIGFHPAHHSESLQHLSITLPPNDFAYAIQGTDPLLWLVRGIQKAPAELPCKARVVRQQGSVALEPRLLLEEGEVHRQCTPHSHRVPPLLLRHHLRDVLLVVHCPAVAAL